jgi:hypothetical protein
MQLDLQMWTSEDFDPALDGEGRRVGTLYVDAWKK